MKKYKSCLSEIDPKATKCPHCRADQRNWFRRHPILTGLLVLFVLGVIGTATNGSSNNNSSNATTNTSSDQVAEAQKTPEPTEAPTATPKPTLTPQQIIAQFEKEGQVVTVAQVYKSPNSYKGKSLIFTCTVSGFPKDENGDVGALNCDDPNNFSGNVQIGIDKEIDVTKINENDTIKVYGLGAGALQGKNAFGGDITTGGIVGLYISDLTTGYKNY